MGNGISTDLFGNLDLFLGNQRTRNRGAEQIDAFIDGIGAEHREDVIADEFLAKVLDENVFRLDAEQNRLVARRA